MPEQKWNTISYSVESQTARRNAEPWPVIFRPSGDGDILMTGDQECKMCGDTMALADFSRQVVVNEAISELSAINLIFVC